MSSLKQFSHEGSKLYYCPGSCSSSILATALQLGLKGIQLEQVNLETHKTASGVDFYTINPQGRVPYLVLPDGSSLNETAVLLQLMADQKPDEGLIGGAHGSIERYYALNALNFVATEMHNAVGNLFYLNDQNKETFYSILNKKLKYLNKLLSDHQFLANGKFSIADTYLYIVLGWFKFFPQFDLTPYDNVMKYAARIGEYPHIKAAKEIYQENPATL